MANFEKARSKKSEIEAEVRVYLVEQKGTYKGKSTISWNLSFEDGNSRFFVTFGELKKLYDIADKKGNKKRAYCGTAYKLSNNNGR